ncbi:MAG: DUF2125 domain-containing protein [Alphaproteobacteria bacterium]|nr:DUF2125 domain-containing protein [Alphaproteobacteria bacterium]
MRRPLRAALVFLALLFIAAAGYVACWYAAAEALKREVQAVAATDAYPLLVGGFPKEVVLSLDRVLLSKDDWTLIAERVLVRRAMRGIEVNAEVSGPIAIRYGERAVTVSAAQPARVTLRDGAVAIAMRGATIVLPDSTWTVRRLNLDYAPGGGTAPIPMDSRLRIVAEDIVVPEARRGPFGDTIAALQATAQLQVRAVTTTHLPDALLAWREGGRLLIGTLVRWGSLDATATGFYRLDTQLLPIAQIAELPQLLDAIQAARWIGDAERAAVMGEARGFIPAGPNRLVVPLEVKDGAVWVHSTRVTPRWPSGGTRSCTHKRDSL